MEVLVWIRTATDIWLEVNMDAGITDIKDHDFVGSDAFGIVFPRLIWSSAFRVPVVASSCTFRGEPIDAAAYREAVFMSADGNGDDCSTCRDVIAILAQPV